MDMTQAYENGRFIENGDQYQDYWRAKAEPLRELEATLGRARLNLAYGSDELEALDIFYPQGRPAGLLLFVHGGYWRASDRTMWSHLSAGAVARDWAVAIPSYAVVPNTRISNIAPKISQALELAASKVLGPIAICGHSAGGHLVARLLCQNIDLSSDVTARLTHCMPISPVSDLRPLVSAKGFADLALDEREAANESPVLNKDIRDVETTVWVGAEERPAFLDQARWLAQAWGNAELHIAPGRHHFDVIQDLEDSNSPMMNTLLKNS